jgi:aspartyl aminopeptidase
MLSEQLGVSAGDILDFELHVCDVQPATLGGAREEFVFAGGWVGMRGAGGQSLPSSCHLPPQEDTHSHIHVCQVAMTS